VVVSVLDVAVPAGSSEHPATMPVASAPAPSDIPMHRARTAAKDSMRDRRVRSPPCQRAHGGARTGLARHATVRRPARFVLRFSADLALACDLPVPSDFMGRILGSCAVVGALSWVAACGGNVVVEPGTGGGGQGGTGGPGGIGGTPTTTGPTTTTTTTTTTTGVGGGEQQGLCQKACTQLAQMMCDGAGPSCTADCADFFESIQSSCKDEFAAYLACFIAVLPQVGCNPEQPVCEKEVNAYGNCENGSGGAGGSGVGGGSVGCDEIQCSGDINSCGCKGFCQGQVWTAECKAQGNQYDCNCYVDGNQVGACNEFNSPCDIEFGCCSDFFF